MTDDQGVTVTCPVRRPLPPVPARPVTCTATGTAEAGQYENVGTVTGTTPDGGVVQDSDGSHYFGEDAVGRHPEADQPRWTPIRRRGRWCRSGGRVTWIYVVTNTGNVGLNQWVVTDPEAPFMACPRIGLIVPGQTIVCFSRRKPRGDRGSVRQRR